MDNLYVSHSWKTKREKQRERENGYPSIILMSYVERRHGYCLQCKTLTIAWDKPWSSCWSSKCSSFHRRSIQSQTPGIGNQNEFKKIMLIILRRRDSPASRSFGLRVKAYLKVLLDARRSNRLRDHNDVPLDVEADQDLGRNRTSDW